MVYEPVTLVDWAGFKKSFWLEGSPTFFLFVKNQNKTDGLNFFQQTVLTTRCYLVLILKIRMNILKEDKSMNQI
jgi:hypothetical protein